MGCCVENRGNNGPLSSHSTENTTFFARLQYNVKHCYYTERGQPAPVVGLFLKCWPFSIL